MGGLLEHVLTNGSIHGAAESLGVAINQIDRDAILQQIRVPLSEQSGTWEDILWIYMVALRRKRNP